MHSGYTFFHQYVCSLGIEPSTFCAANAMLYHWATGTPVNYNVYGLKNASNSKRACVRSGIWTHSSMWRSETSTTEKEMTPWVWCLRPLSHSDIPCKVVKDLHWSDGKINNRVYNVYGLKNASNSKELVSEVGFDPTPPCWEQKPQQLR